MKRKKILSIILFFIILVGIIWLPYLLSDNEVKILDAAERAKSGGTFVKLSVGYTNYELAGPDSGKIVLLIHGGGPALWIWDRQVDALHKAGFRTLRFDRYGAGYSDRIDTAYTWELLLNQVVELLDTLHITHPIHVVGRSLGGRVAACFAAMHPDRVDKLVLVSAAVMMPKNQIVTRIPLISFIPRYIKRVFGRRILKNMIKKYEPYIGNTKNAEKYKRMLFDDMRFRGSERAFSAIFNHDNLLGCRKSMQGLSNNKISTAMIWGSNDRLVPEKRIEKLKERLNHIHFYAIPDAGHGVNFTHYKIFNKILLAFLEEKGSTSRQRGRKI